MSQDGPNQTANKIELSPSTQTDDARRHAPATARNRNPILEVLRPLVAALPKDATLLEIASGTGEHAVFFARALPQLRWQPSEPDPDLRASIRDHQAAEGSALENLRPPIDLDVTRFPWPISSADAMICVNMIHIAPWSCCEALMKGAAQLLPTEGPLLLYGPFRRGGSHTSSSNVAFDDSLQARNPTWGIRDLEQVATTAESRGLRLTEVQELPANNLAVIFRRHQRMDT
ncbi:DUF938 domain-containing protein [Algihabitans albus]|uniref:DUF938 domain-containing protein n=1 Tax=Algihabitans albus TaxID=2164067 RepID=UPI0022876AA8|nr:DUF938 domain-containing protein [Algihabitans albus]